MVFAGNHWLLMILNLINLELFGINVETGEIVSHGHTHHMRAINRINKSGSIEAAVKDGTLKVIMYECVKNNVLCFSRFYT